MPLIRHKLTCTYSKALPKTLEKAIAWGTRHTAKHDKATIHESDMEFVREVEREDLWGHLRCVRIVRCLAADPLLTCHLACNLS